MYEGFLCFRQQMVDRIMQRSTIRLQIQNNRIGFHRKRTKRMLNKLKPVRWDDFIIRMIIIIFIFRYNLNPKLIIYNIV